MEECRGLTSSEANKFQDRAAVVASAVAVGAVDHASVVAVVGQGVLWPEEVCSSASGVILHCLRSLQPAVNFTNIFTSSF